MNESDSLTDKIGVAFGTCCSPEVLIATIEDLLSSEFSLHNLCVVGQADSMSQSLALLKKQPKVDAGRVALFAQTESFFGDNDVASSVGSRGSFLSLLQSLMERRRNCTDVSRANEYSIDSPELKKQIDEGYLTLFVRTSDLDLQVPALRILIKRSSFSVQSHEFRQ